MTKKTLSLGLVFVMVCAAGTAFAQSQVREREYQKDIARLFGEGKPNEALRLNREMIQRFPRRVMGYVNMAHLYHVLGNPQEAIEYCNQGLCVIDAPEDGQDRNDLFQAHSLLATIYDEQNKPDQAVAEYEAALALNPASDFVIFAMGKLYARFGDTDKARAAFSKVIEMGNSCESGGILAGSALREREELDK